jgi:hypothetical protein
MMNRFCISGGLAAAFGCLMAVSPRMAFAANTTLDLYHLGESDSPTAASGNIGDATTVDSGPGAHNLGRFNSPTYSSNAAPGSTISMAFNPSPNIQDYDAPNQTTATTYIGIDAWIYPTVGALTTSVGIAYNGNPGSSGYGLYQAGTDLGFTVPAGDATIIALVGGVDFLSPTVPAVNVPLNAWSEVTQILEGGNNELFLNGTLVASHADTAHTPDTDFELGHGFTGNIDEVQIFSTPEPATMGLLGLASLGILVRRKRVIR